MGEKFRQRPVVDREAGQQDQVLLGGSTSRRILRVVTAITTRSKFGVLLIPENTRGKNVA